jgi:hypothetical protein
MFCVKKEPLIYEGCWSIKDAWGKFLEPNDYTHAIYTTVFPSYVYNIHVLYTVLIVFHIHMCPQSETSTTGYDNYEQL